VLADPTEPLILQLDTTSSLGATWRGGRCPALVAMGIVRE